MFVFMQQRAHSCARNRAAVGSGDLDLLHSCPRACPCTGLFARLYTWRPDCYRSAPSVSVCTSIRMSLRTPYAHISYTGSIAVRQHGASKRLHLSASAGTAGASIHASMHMSMRISMRMLMQISVSMTMHTCPHACPHACLHTGTPNVRRRGGGCS